MSPLLNKFSIRISRQAVSPQEKEAEPASSQPANKQRDPLVLPPRHFSDPQWLKLYRAIDLAG